MRHWKHVLAAALTVTAVIVPARQAVAHEGHGETATGTVSEVAESTLTLDTREGDRVTFAFREDTAIKRGDAEIRRDQIEVGERAVVRYEEQDDAKIAHEVLLSPLGTTAAGTGDDPETARLRPASATPSAALQPVEHRFVCMVNDAVFDREQIPVEVDGKTYYGCCPMCEERLSSDAEARAAVDPVSGNPVDKATAIIAARPDGSVLYFESEATLARFAAQSNRQ